MAKVITGEGPRIKVAQYHLSGTYLFNKLFGTQNGEVTYYSDCKVIGLVEDVDAVSNKAVPKLLLGIADEGFLKFVKYPFPEFPAVKPVVWDMELKGEIVNEDIRGTYTGSYIFEPNLNLRGYSNLSVQDLKKITRGLSRIPLDRLVEEYLPRHIFLEARVYGPKKGQTGVLSLTKV